MTKLEELKKIREKIDLEVKGIDNYDLKTPTIFIANHNCLLDIFYLPMSIPIEIVSLISSRLIYKKENSRQEMVNKYLNSFPIEAHGGMKYANMCLEYAGELLKEGMSLSIFPEGAYIQDCVIHKGRTGATRILYNARSNDLKINLVPVSISIDKNGIDLDDYSHFDKSVIVTILKPIDYEEEYYKYINTDDMVEKNQCLHIPIDKGMKQIASNLGIEYKDEYIKLRPKGNVIFADGTTVQTDQAIEESYISQYEEELKQKVKTLGLYK